MTDRYRTRLLTRWIALAVIVLGVLSGCANNPKNPADPWESFNRKVWDFNEDVDRVYLKPVASGYRKVMPAPARRSVGNFFRNLLEPTTIINDLLQGKFTDAASATGRFLVNSSVGILGLFDVATKWGIERHEEDFGQTFAKWGVPPGPYLVIPLIGPSNVRDGIGLLPYYFATDPRLAAKNIETTIALVGVDVIDRRAQLLTATRILDLQLDPYAFTREAYRQKRRDLIYDGEPPLEPNP